MLVTQVKECPYLKASSSSFRHGRWATRERGKEGAPGAEGVGGADRIGEEEDAIVPGQFGSNHSNLTPGIWVIHLSDCSSTNFTKFPYSVLVCFALAVRLSWISSMSRVISIHDFEFTEPFNILPLLTDNGKREISQLQNDMIPKDFSALSIQTGPFAAH